VGIAESAALDGDDARSILERSVGTVTRRSVSIPLGPEGFRTDGGRVLGNLEVAYETYGSLAADGCNAILMTPPLTGDCHVAGFYGDPPDLRTRGWWDDMVGPGKAIDTNRWFVVCASMLGGCGGTTGPVTIDPSTGRPYGSAFPDLTIGDMVEAQRLLLAHLGVTRLYAVVGGSMGGMQALEWSLRHPGMVERCICVAAAASLSAQALAFDIIGRNAILNDDNWARGRYEPGAGPDMGLALARKIAHITYLSAEKMDSKFGRRQRPDDATERFHTAFEIEKYLEHQGEKFVARFDANAYLLITQAMDGFDLGAEWGRTPLPETSADEAEWERVEFQRLSEAFDRSDCRYLIVALSSDWLFPAAASREVARVLLHTGRAPSFCVLKSPHGHDGFLLEAEKLDLVVDAFLADGKSRRASRDSSTIENGRQLFRSEPDRKVIASMVARGSRVLDVGCGDGSLLEHLVREKGCRGVGVDIDLDAVIATLARGLPAIQGDVDAGLSEFPDQSFDQVVLNQTLQAVQKPPVALREILRVGREAIVSFPNFANWRCRLDVLLGGRMPKTRDLPFEWYETPNLHPFTLADFEDYCRTHGIDILESCEQCDSWLGKVLQRMGLRNLAADRAIYRIASRER
jgi:homoserine O-acetyltransferase/O-succinyltransferase